MIPKEGNSLCSMEKFHVETWKRFLLESSGDPLVPVVTSTDSWSDAGQMRRSRTSSGGRRWPHAAEASASGFTPVTCTSAQLRMSSFTSKVKSLGAIFLSSSTPAGGVAVKSAFLMPQHAAAYPATTQREISALWHSPQHYRVSIFRKSETLPVWFWECWYCLCCCCACCCCACGTCCVCGCCWMYPTVLRCGTLVCKNVDPDPPCTSPWVICRHRKEYECPLGCSLDL